MVAFSPPPPRLTDVDQEQRTLAEELLTSLFTSKLLQDSVEYSEESSDAPLKRKSPYILKRQTGRNTKSRRPYILKRSTIY
uniref:Neurotensin/neuromedin N n=1 Tax=Kryptolebias marmoratus TaxID=37003 RepID=A0A3Q3G5N9_KRYMA